MRKLRPQLLTAEGFARYGTFTDLIAPQSPLFEKGQPQFYSDLATVELGCEHGYALSVALEEKRPENVIEFSEYHRTTGEGMVPLNGDIVIYCAPPTEGDTPPFDHFEAFLVPAGTAVILRRGVWHGCQFPVSEERVSTLILLPERTYANDCVLYFHQDDEKLLVE